MEDRRKFNTPTRKYFTTRDKARRWISRTPNAMALSERTGQTMATSSDSQWCWTSVNAQPHPLKDRKSEGAVR